MYYFQIYINFFIPNIFSIFNKTVKMKITELPEDVQTYYKINMDKSIDKFNIALEKLEMKTLFYEFFNEDDIPLKDVIYLIIDGDVFYWDDKPEFEFGGEL